MTTPQPVSFSTAGLPEDQRVALWEDHNAHELIGLRCRTLSEATLNATELNLQLGHVLEPGPSPWQRHPTDDARWVDRTA